MSLDRPIVFEITIDILKVYLSLILISKNGQLLVSVCKIPLLTRALGQAKRATIGFLVYMTITFLMKLSNV